MVHFLLLEDNSTFPSHSHPLAPIRGQPTGDAKQIVSGFGDSNDSLLKMIETDMQLLSRYARQDAEEAFAEIVRRHLDLVFSTALRQVRSAPLAEEVAQSAFTDLARQAAQLAPATVLPAWLYQVTRRTAIDVIRREARRQVREQIACEMNAMNTPASDWSHIEPVLEEAMDALEETDRAAILLRYFENKSLREVGETLGTNEDAARKRVSRAVERLRQIFVQRGVAIGANGLGIALSASAVYSSPAGLAVTISHAAALAGKTFAATATVTKAIAMTTLQKAVIGAALAVAVTAGVYETLQSARAGEEKLGIQQQQAPLVEQVEQMTQDRDEAKRRLDSLRAEHERLVGNAAELLKLRSEVARLRQELRPLSQGNDEATHDPTAALAQAWAGRITLLKQRFEEWPGKKTPELQLLTNEDWLKEASKHDLESDTTCREAMSRLRSVAKLKFADAVKGAMERFLQSNQDQLPTDATQLAPFLKPPMDSFLDGYELAKRGWVSLGNEYPQWALVEKGAFTPDGQSIRDGTILSDPEHDEYRVISATGSWGYTAGKPLLR